MYTVNEIAQIAGISIRTLHYYDEIGLLKPTSKSEAGYRLYDDNALETLQQILYFREFDIPLKNIKSIMESSYDRNQILAVQKKMLISKKERIERLIKGIDNILKGDKEMDFSVFSKSELEELFQIMLERMPKNIQDIAVSEFGSIDQWKKHYLETLTTSEIQSMYSDVFDLYGGKDNYLAYIREEAPKEEIEKFKQWENRMLERILSLRNANDPIKLKQIIKEYGAGNKDFFQIKEETAMMLSYANSLKNEMAVKQLDERFGAGTSEFLSHAIEMSYM